MATVGGFDAQADFKNGVSLEITGVAEAVSLLDRLHKEAPRARYWALRRTVDGMATDVARSVRQTLDVKYREAKKAIGKRRPSSFSDPTAFVRISGAPLRLSEFGRPKQLKKRGVSVRILKNEKRKVIPTAFMAKDKKGEMQVWWRVKEGGDLVGRLPIEGLYGPSIPAVIEKRSLQALEAKGAERFKKQLTHEVDRILHGYGKKRKVL